MPFSFKTSCAMGAIIAAMTSVSAFAQADQPVPQDAAPQQAIFPEDIVVTAERRESTVREVPFSIGRSAANCYARRRSTAPPR